MARFRNWGGTVSFRPASIRQPHHVDELRTIVRDAAVHGRRVRVAGSGHSWSPLVDCPDVLLDLRHFQACRIVDRDRRFVAVGAGVRLSRLNNFLASRQLALRNLSYISDQTVVGAVMTGTHGTGPAAVLATQVAHLTLVTATAEVHEIDAQDRDLFDAVRISLGTLGIIVEVQMHIVPRFNLRQERRVLRFDAAFGEEMSRRLAPGSYHQYKWLPFTDQVVYERSDVTELPADMADEPSPPRSPPGEWVLTRTATSMVRLKPTLTPAINRMGRTLQMFKPGVRVGRSDLLLNGTPAPKYLETEYGLPLERGREAMERYRELCLRERLAVNFPVLVRFAAGDDLWLSLAHGRSTVFIGVLATPGRGFARARAAIEPMLAALEGRPHWGKLFVTPADLAKRYPRYEHFRTLMARFDPEGRFRNAMIDGLFSQHVDVTGLEWSPDM